MTTYKDVTGKSGITEYEIGGDFIKIRFGRDRKIYVYDYNAPGQKHVDRMKELAVSGQGLATYISQNVRKNYSRIE